jgi:DNA (cytosine-5)-methyltransferase 1
LKEVILKTQINKFKIKELMAKKEIGTQAELAKILGISKQQLSMILSDKFNPIKSNVQEIANFFKVSPSDLISKETTKDKK